MNTWTKNTYRKVKEILTASDDDVRACTACPEIDCDAHRSTAAFSFLLYLAPHEVVAVYAQLKKDGVENTTDEDFAALAFTTVANLTT